MTGEQIENIVTEFMDMFTETYQDGSDWGIGVRIKSDGTKNDRQTLDDILDFLTQALQKYGEKVREELLIDLKKVLQKGYTPEVEEDILTSLTKQEK